MKLHRWASAGMMALLLGASTVVFAQDKPEDAKPQDEPKREEAAPRKDEMKPKQDEVKPEKRQEEQRAQEGQEKREANARPAGKSQRIPDDKFRQNFGREHVTVINRPVIVEGRPRFQTGGYWFEIVDPWPVGWAYSDQVYIDYIDGEYFLFDVLHPGVRVALFVTL
jgi:hypothetical protein